jgi:transcriptional regulator with XRE-family HTH domain
VTKRGRGKEPDYPITEEWLRNVREALGTERGAQARLAEQIGCSPGTLTELLNGAKRSHLVPRISKALGVPMSTMLLTPDAIELQSFLDEMGERGREAMRRLKSLEPHELELMLGLLDAIAKKRQEEKEISEFVEQMGDRGREAMRRLKSLEPDELEPMLGVLDAMAKKRQTPDEK